VNNWNWTSESLVGTQTHLYSFWCSSENINTFLCFNRYKCNLFPLSNSYIFNMYAHFNTKTLNPNKQFSVSSRLSDAQFSWTIAHYLERKKCHHKSVRYSALLHTAAVVCWNASHQCNMAHDKRTVMPTAEWYTRYNKLLTLCHMIVKWQKWSCHVSLY